MGAILVYVACYMILAGVQVITSRMLDARRIFVVGLALVFGLSVDMVPGLYAGVPHHLQPIFSSSLALSTIAVVLLNVLFRIGVTRRKVLQVTRETDGSQAIFDFMETQGSLWGARRDVVSRAAAAVHEFFESAGSARIVDGKAEVDVSFDEFNLDVDIRYDGELVEFASLMPAADGLAGDIAAVAVLSSYLIRQYADSVSAEIVDGRCIVHLHFEH
jgi:NCS2 family nucleobase:cation symporter-2